MIVVTAATGQLGRLVLAHLVRKGLADALVAAVRDPAKAADLAALGVQVREADYDRPDTLAKAFAGAATVLLISSPAVGRRVQQHQNAVQAAQAAGVQWLVYTSLLHADRSPLGLLAEEHWATEQCIMASGLNYTILRNGWYLENYAPIVRAAITHGVLVGSAGNGRIAAAPRADYAEAAAAVLTTEGHLGKVYELAGDEAFRMADIADELSRLTGKPIAYRQVSPDEYARWLVTIGFPEPVARFYAALEDAIAQDALFDDSHQLRQLLGRPTTSWRAALAALVQNT